MQEDKNKKFFITGANGQLGRDLISELISRGFECVGSDLGENFTGSENCKYISLDITNYKDVETAIKKFMPDRIIHCAAWTAVDAAEDEENKSKVFAVNVTGTSNIARACKEIKQTAYCNVRRSFSQSARFFIQGNFDDGQRF